MKYLIIFIILNPAVCLSIEKLCLDILKNSPSIISVKSIKEVKQKTSGAKIFRIEYGQQQIKYFKENSENPSNQNFIFDDPEVVLLVTRAAQSLGLGQFVPNLTEVRNLKFQTSDGQSVLARSGLLQDGFADIQSPIEKLLQENPPNSMAITPEEIIKILNQDEWPRLYANWKIFWMIFLQTDLNIGNFARHGIKNFFYDLGDALNFQNVRREMGIEHDIDNVNFNLPNNPNIRAQYRADFRLADPEFKRMAELIANETAETTAARFGKKLTDVLRPPRGLMKDHILAMKTEARRVLDLLNKGPFDY